MKGGEKMNMTVVELKDSKIQEVAGKATKKKKNTKNEEQNTFLSAIQLVQHQLSSSRWKEKSESLAKPSEQKSVQQTVNQVNKHSIEKRFNGEGSETSNHVLDQKNVSFSHSKSNTASRLQTTEYPLNGLIDKNNDGQMTTLPISNNVQSQVKLLANQLHQSPSLPDKSVTQESDVHNNIILQSVKTKTTSDPLLQQALNSSDKFGELETVQKVRKSDTQSNFSINKDLLSSPETDKQKNDGNHLKTWNSVSMESRNKSDHLRAVSGVMNKLELWSSYQSGKSQEKQTPVHQQVADQISEWLGKSSLKLEKGSSENFTISLSPENLGKLTISISRGDQGLIAQFTAETKAAKDLLESGLNQLKHDCAGKGISFAQIDVNRQLQTVTPEHAQNQGQQQGDFQQHHERKDEQQQEQEKHRNVQMISNDEQLSNHSFSEWMTGGMI